MPVALAEIALAGLQWLGQWSAEATALDHSDVPEMRKTARQQQLRRSDRRCQMRRRRVSFDTIRCARPLVNRGGRVVPRVLLTVYLDIRQPVNEQEGGGCLSRRGYGGRRAVSPSRDGIAMKSWHHGRLHMALACFVLGDWPCSFKVPGSSA